MVGTAGITGGASYDRANGQFTCVCGERFHVPESRVGARVRCPFCYDLVTVPEPVAIPPRPPLVTPARLRLLALLLLVPLGGPLGVWLASRPPAATAGEPSPVVPPTDPASASDPAPEPVEPAEVAAVTVPGPAFVDPPLQARLAILYRMIVAYNRDDPGRGDPVMNGTNSLGGRDQIPDAEQPTAWFANLTPRQRVAIDAPFRDRRKYLEYARARRRDDGAPSSSGGATVEMFARPEDVFVSPRDGKPFLIGPKIIRFPDDHYARDTRVIVREQEGVKSWDHRYMEERWERTSLAFGWGEIGRFYVPIVDGVAGEEPTIANPVPSSLLGGGDGCIVQGGRFIHLRAPGCGLRAPAR